MGFELEKECDLFVYTGGRGDVGVAEVLRLRIRADRNTRNELYKAVSLCERMLIGRTYDKG